MKLQLKEDLTLDNAIQYARRAELVKSQMTEQGEGVKELEEATTRQSSQRRFGSRRGTTPGYRGQRWCYRWQKLSEPSKPSTNPGSEVNHRPVHKMQLSQAL